ncbi:hypothetical protein D3C80_1680980 [compost metagenome]
MRFARLPNDVPLLSGYSADVEILLQQHPRTLRVPTESVLDGGRVLRLDPASGHLREQKVEIGLTNWRWSEVTAGLDAGDKVIAGHDRDGLRDGSLVTAIDTRENKQ